MELRIGKYRDTTIYHCRFCHMCQHVCTVANITHNEAHLTRGQALTLFSLLKGIRDFDEDVVERLYQCTNCGVCMSWCWNRYDISEVIRDVRADIADCGKAPKQALVVRNSVIEADNPYREPKSLRSQRVKAITNELPKYAKVLLFLGCTTTYLKPEIGIASVELLKRAGIDFTILKEEGCCGYPLSRLGFYQETIQVATRNRDSIEKSGANTIVFTCPSCYRVMAKEYPKFNLEFNSQIRFLHISEYLSELFSAKRLKIKGEENVKITYHDPCDLGRFLEIFEAPRRLIKAVPGAELVEMENNRDKARCCGSGGGTVFTNPGIASAAARSRTLEAKQTGAGTILTACPWCKEAFEREVTSMGGLEVLDLTQFLIKAIKG